MRWRELGGVTRQKQEEKKYKDDDDVQSTYYRFRISFFKDNQVIYSDFETSLHLQLVNYSVQSPNDDGPKPPRPTPRIRQL